jgi:hypothetical protein
MINEYKRYSPMHDFMVSRLAGDEARLAYPLIREVEPGVPLETWLSFVRRTANPHARRTGIMVATRKGQRFPCGLFCYRCHEDLRLGNVVTADYFVAVDMLDPTPVVDAMIDALESLGEQLLCHSVRTVAHRRADVLSGCLRTWGHRVEATNFVKHLEGETLAA